MGDNLTLKDFRAFDIDEEDFDCNKKMIKVFKKFAGKIAFIRGGTLNKRINNLSPYSLWFKGLFNYSLENMGPT